MRDSHTSFTKIGRGVVNFNGQNDVNGAAQDGDVEQLNMSGGLLRLTNYGNATGRRFDAGAMITLAGGGIEMDGASSIQNETANYTRRGGRRAVQLPDGADAHRAGRIGRDRHVQGGAHDHDEHRIAHAGDESSVRRHGELRGERQRRQFEHHAAGQRRRQHPGGRHAYAWATYGDSYTYNAAAATYSLNALDFAMTTGGSGDLAAFAGATRQNEDDVTLVDGRE
jgi:hypothetical protein